MTIRMQRVNNLIRRELAQILYQDVKDPRLGNFVSVNEVSVSSDLRTAQIYVSFFGSDAEQKDALLALSQASGFFHGELMKRLSLRRVPELKFRWDESIERAAHIFDVIDRVNRDDPAG